MFLTEVLVGDWVIGHLYLMDIHIFDQLQYIQSNLIMIGGFKIIASLAVYFTRNMETKPLYKVKGNLVKFLQARASKEDFQQSFSAYQTYLLRTLEENPEPHHQKMEVLDLVSKIYQKYKLPTQKLNKIHNRIAEQCLEIAEKEGCPTLVRVLTMMQRFNRSKALAIYNKNRQNIMAKMRSFSPPQTLQLLYFLKEVKINDPIIRQTSIELLFNEIDFLSPHEIQVLLSCLAFSKKYINKDFLAKVGKRVFTFYKSNNITDKEIPIFLTYISEIQANLHSRSVYVEELDSLYEVILPHLLSTANQLDDYLLSMLVNAIRRSKYFQQPFLTRIANIAISRPISEFSTQEEKEVKTKTISLITFLNIVHTHAVFNYHQPDFKAYVMSVLKILMLKEEPLQINTFFKMLWALCVLYERHQLAVLYPLIERYIIKVSEVGEAHAYNIYYCYLYLRTTCPQISEHRDHIYHLMEGYFVKTHPSQTQLQVYHTMIELGVPCIPEYRLNNLTCDIMIPQWKSLKNTIVELHGFRHFCRNVKRLTGSNALKEKILSAEMYTYYFIAVDEWLMAEDKQTFLLDFLTHINSIEEQRLKENPKNRVNKPAVTATRIRRQPRVFRVSSTPSLPQ